MVAERLGGSRRNIRLHLPRQPKVGRSIDERIRSLVENLMNFPDRGRPGRIGGTRELVVPGTPYIVAYRRSGDYIRVLRVIHGARRWPETI